MPTTAYNRKYVYLSPQRAHRAWECVQLVMRTQALERERILASGTQDLEQLGQADAIRVDTLLLHDICARLSEQASRSNKLKPLNSGQIVLPPKASDYMPDETELTLVEPPQ